VRDLEMHGAILYVVDRRPSATHRAFGEAIGAQIVWLDDFVDAHLNSDPSIVFDVDLRRIETVRRLKSILARRGNGCHIFAVDPKIRVTCVHANVLGAHFSLPLPLEPRQVLEALHAHFGVRASPEAMVSIHAGVNALQRGFRAMSEQVQFDTQGAVSASAGIVDAMETLGAVDWLAAVRGYHQGTFQHCLLVTGVVCAFSLEVGMARRDVVTLTTAGLLHDIGKAVVPLAILDKPTPLTADEMAVMRLHPQAGYDYLLAKSGISSGALRSVRHHHEFLDGSGYPDGLSGSQIDDITRIVTICDIYSALIERRSYKEAKSPAQAMIVLNAMADAGKVEKSLVRELSRIMLSTREVA
jgi:putative nucleotidyltransferase with HDIG domain